MQIQRKSFKWNLAKDYLDFYHSSARFYETGVDKFWFLNNLFMDKEMFRVQGTKAQVVKYNSFWTSF
jgi:hypothetical protein